MHRAPDLREVQDLIASALRRSTSITPLRHANPPRCHIAAAAHSTLSSPLMQRDRYVPTDCLSSVRSETSLWRTPPRTVPRQRLCLIEHSFSYLSVLRLFGYLSAFSFYVQRLHFAFPESTTSRIASPGPDPSHSSASHSISTAGHRQMAHCQSLGPRMSREPPLTLGIVRRVDGAEKHLDEPHLGGEVDALNVDRVSFVRSCASVPAMQATGIVERFWTFRRRKSAEESSRPM